MFLKWINSKPALGQSIEMVTNISPHNFFPDGNWSGNIFMPLTLCVMKATQEEVIPVNCLPA